MTSQVKPGAALAAAVATSTSSWLAPANCNADSSDMACKLARFLPVLYVVASVLGIALLVVLGIAVHAWRKNKETEIVRR